MNTQFVLDHLGHVFCFWLVWKFLDIGWHLFDVQMIIDRLAHKRDPMKPLAEVVRTRATKEDQAKLAKGLAELIIDMQTVKRQMAAMGGKDLPVPPMENAVVPKPKRGRKIGVSKLDPIPLADECEEPVVIQKKKAAKRRQAIRSTFPTWKMTGS